MNTMMRSHLGNSHGHLLLRSSSLLIFLVGTFAAAQVAPPDTLVKGSNLTTDKTLVSANKSFTLGFFTRGDPPAARRWYLGIWFTVTNSSTDAVFWVANRDRPLPDASGVLVVTDTGNLLLLDGSGGTAWSSNTTGAASPTARLLDSGNLVLFDAAGAAASSGSGDDDNVKKLWQSFDQPTNTLLPGAKIGVDLWGGGGWSLTSWASPDDPSPGEFRYAMRRGGLLPELVMLDATGAIMYRTGVWNGLWFSGVPEMYQSYGNQFACRVTVSPTEISFSYTARAAGPSLSRLILIGTPLVERVGWVPERQGWSDPYFHGPRDDCDHYAKCGPSGGLCNSSAASSTTWDCGCAPGFSPVSQSDWDMRDTTSGCRRDVLLDCGDTTTGSSTSTDWFYALEGVKLPDTLNSSLDANTTLDECRVRCLANCSCVPYAPADIQEGSGTGCLMWPEPLVDLRYVTGGQTLYIRQATSPSVKGKKKKISKRTVAFIVIATALVLVCIGVLTVACFLALKARKIRRRRFIIQMAEAAGQTVQNPPVFSIALSTIKSATKKFSKRNVIGEGTFGIVYEGKLPRGHPLLQGLTAGRTIAVKRLKPIADLPEKIVSYFTREMQLMSGLKQHQNVLRLLAYCDEANEKILVYEYMHRRSLDAYIFGEWKERCLLNWHRRLQIIQGIAEGVKHLHEGEGNVIHRDLKPSNVLLDGGWEAKVADFGTAKLLAAGATGTRTRIGTPMVWKLGTNTVRSLVVLPSGYMAPEYVQNDGGETTLKCDVYSFGVTLLETLSGRSNCERPSLVSEAWRLWVDGSVTALLDPAVAPAPAKPELPLLRRWIQVGLLCVQEKPDERPAMSAVVEMLSCSSSELAEPVVPMVGKDILTALLEADLSRPTVYETIDFT
ncbi:hypothetical protein U9M48_033957 [Paspalum notatum var. saurae]|uniref:Receptor-like serine/threonine-protein kinase n=1 Tax=Paspalum notatum var. saurae TaxID=547442 RepID=A0AAQ3U8M9_PASNO